MTGPPSHRPADRIDTVVSAIRAIWTADPDLRLAQLVVNAANLAGREVVVPELYSLEDGDLLAGLEAYAQARPPANSSVSPRRIELSESETLVLFECLHRMCETERITISHPAEAVVIDKIAGQLERALAEPFDPSYPEVLAAAREEVMQAHRERFGDESWVERLPLDQV